MTIFETIFCQRVTCTIFVYSLHSFFWFKSNFCTLYCCLFRFIYNLILYSNVILFFRIEINISNIILSSYLNTVFAFWNLQKTSNTAPIQRHSLFCAYYIAITYRRAGLAPAAKRNKLPQYKPFGAAVNYLTDGICLFLMFSTQATPLPTPAFSRK